MMSTLLVKPLKYYHWWIRTLKSCLPDSALIFFSKYKKDVELIIRHQSDGIFLQDSQGRVIDSISTIDSTDNEDGVDINLFEAQGDDDTNGDDFDATHIHLTEHREVIHHNFNKKEPEISEVELDNIDLTVENDATLVLNRDDKTLRLMSLAADDDTLVIQDDQGTLLDLSSDSSSGGDSTVLFYSDRGRIRAVEARKEAPKATEIDFHLMDTNPVTEYKENPEDDFTLAAGLLAKHPGNKKCLYLLPDDMVFSLVLNYPVEVLENIENVLRYDLEKHIPLSFQEIRFFYALNILSATATVDVEVLVIKSVVFNALESAFASEDKREIICTTRHFYQHYGTKINILGNRKGESQNPWLSLGNLHTAFNITLLLGLLVLPYVLQYQQLGSIQQKTSAEISKAGEIVSTINQLNAEIETGRKLNDQIARDHRMVELLAQLSEHIATDAWISRLSYKNGELKLKGEAVSATSVSDDLNDTGLFESIKFVSSIVKNPNTKKETFELSLKVKSDA